MYRIQQFAQLAGVTVRTLHHYDRLGLLKPRHRTDGGYRLYAMKDLAQLQRIQVLRYIGLPLREIGEILGHADAIATESLPEMLSRQASVLRERRDGLDRVLRAVEHAERKLQSGTSPDLSFYTTILKEIEMQETHNWTRKYYSDSAQQMIDERARNWTPELQAQADESWSKMFARVEAAIADHVAPESTEGRAIADAWMELVGQFTGGNPEVLDGLTKLYNDRENWPETAKPIAPMNPAVTEFIMRAKAQ